MEINKLIKERYSPVVFLDKEIDEQLLMQLFEAARWAPSAFNEQPWRFLYCSKKDKERYEKLFSCLVDGNKEWAKTAPALMLVLAKKNFSHHNKPNSFHQFDTGMAVENFIIAAMEHGVFVHQMGGFSADQAREKFTISDDYSIISVAAIGYPGDINTLPEALKQRAEKPRVRKEISEILF